MEKQVMGEFVRILRISRTVIVSLQLLQTMSIVIQNLKNEHSICKRYLWPVCGVVGRLSVLGNFGISLNLICDVTCGPHEEVVSFPLYVEAIRFAFHEESMIRTAVRALTLNVYHVGDEAVNKFVASHPHADYFSNLVKFFWEQCINLDKLVNASKCQGSDTTGSILSSVDEIEDNLYYFSDVISAGIPDIGRLITDLLLKDTGLGTATSLYLLCCILRIVKIKDLANIVAAVLLCDIETFVPRSEAKLNGFMVNHDMSPENQESENGGFISDSNGQSLRVLVPNISSSLNNHPEDGIPQPDHGSTYSALREALLSYITTGDDVQVSGSLSMLATLLQTKGYISGLLSPYQKKWFVILFVQMLCPTLIRTFMPAELEESMLDALGILPQRKQQKKLLLAKYELRRKLYKTLCKDPSSRPIDHGTNRQALVGEGSAEEQLFSSANLVKDGIGSEMDCYLQKLKEQYELLCVCKEVTVSPRRQRFQVLDALVSLLCRSNISAETLWDGGWLLRQLLPYSEADFNSHHLKLLKVFVLLHQLHIFSVGKVLPDQPPIHPTVDVMETSRAKRAGIDSLGPKPSIELSLVDAVPCRIAFERGKERHFHFLAISVGTSGWLILADELPVRPSFGVVRVVAPLGGCNPRIDEKHMRWLHLRIRPSSFPYIDAAKHTPHAKVKSKALVDGRWTLAFRDEDSCKAAYSMIIEELKLLSYEVERRIKPMLDIERTIDTSTK
ncbi:hypothetical protein RND71_024383 [Anisodus tanguticus]|uniref:FPL domain-containing protein n=1 Tax=Anisodus tanguticus TaxID=243964 RepID=A0AAE1RR00_9SOLA|nr:hypothetical protein RND71_024383 [Anisodus tanguticus]